MEFDPSVFADPYYLRLGDMITKYVSIDKEVSQVVEINSKDFCSALPKERLHFADEIPEKVILKVYDPNWGDLHVTEENDEGREVPMEYTFQIAIDFEVAEVETYCRLASLMGDVIPRLYTYGNLSDIQVSVGKPYVRLYGPFLMIEELEDDGSKMNITKAFYENKIIPAFRKLHDLNIIHNDVCRENMIITKDGEFKLINFRHSKYTESAEDKAKELEFLKKYINGETGRRDNALDFLQDRDE